MRNQQINESRKNMRRKVAAETMYLSDDLVAEILSRLPVQSLVRFKTTCKSWNSIISNPSFPKLHLQNYGNNNNFLLLASDETTRLSLTTFGISSSPESTTLDELYFLESPTKMESHIFKNKIVGPVNGFICIYGTAIVEEVSLCNPNLRTAEIVTRCPIPDNDFSLSGYSTRRSMGLGQDYVTKEIKLVQILSYVFHVVKIGIRVDIYSPSTKSWRQVFDYDDAATSDIFVHKAIGSYKDGSFAHWLDTTQVYVLSFDMRREVFVRTPLPIRCNGYEKKMKIIAKDSSSLVLFVYPRYPVWDENYLFDRWELNGLGEQGKHWSWLTRVGPFLGVSKPVGALWSSRLLVVREGNKLVFYDYSAQRVRRIYYLKNYKFNRHGFIKVLEYKGSPF